MAAMPLRYPVIALATALWGAAAVAADPQPPAVDVVPASQLQWGYLNPARGDKGPAAANLWGDRTKNAASGILLEFPEGFASPPHIHNITYRGIVISGELHNDDPAAANMWMPVGSYWTQPAGEPHITAARGTKNLAYIEIDSGPYLVQSVGDAFDRGEQPVNLVADNMVWLDGAEVQAVTPAVEISYLWRRSGNSPETGVMLRLPGGFDGEIRVAEGSFRAVVISGSPVYGKAGGTSLPPGSYIGSTGSVDHRVFVDGGAPVLLYVRSSAALTVQPD